MDTNQEKRFNNAIRKLASVCGVSLHTIVASLMIADEVMVQEKIVEDYGKRVQRELRSINKNFLEKETER